MNLSLLFEDAQKVIDRVDFKPLDGAHILITGATGLLGTHFLATLRLLRDSGYDIDVICLYHNSVPLHTRLLSQNDFRFLNFLPLMGEIDVVIHAAGYAQPAIFTTNPIETLQLNTTLTQQLFDRMERNGKFLFLSSSEVYSGLNKWDALETDIGSTTPYHPRACYIEGKRCGETIVNTHRQQGIKAASARVSLTYGPGVRQNDKRALSQFIDQAIRTGEINMGYSGREMRTYCYVRDAITILWNILLHGIHPVYNVGGRSSTSMAELASHVSAITGATLKKPRADEELNGAPSTVKINTALAEDEFGRSDHVSLMEGLERTIEWHKELYAL